MVLSRRSGAIRSKIFLAKPQRRKANFERAKLDLLQITPTHFKIAFPPLGRRKREFLSEQVRLARVGLKRANQE